MHKLHYCCVALGRRDEGIHRNYILYYYIYTYYFYCIYEV